MRSSTRSLSSWFVAICVLGPLLSAIVPVVVALPQPAPDLIPISLYQQQWIERANGVRSTLADAQILHRRQSSNSSSSSSSSAAKAANSLSQQKANLIKQTLQQTANKSWEMGAHAQALLEFDYPRVSVFFSSYVPVPTSPVATSVLDIVSQALQQRQPGSLQIVPDGSAADPASLGVAVILANYTSPNGQQTRDEMATVAQDQLTALLQETPRTNDGAISHRVEEMSLWSDFMYMVPPFLAYYGVVNQNSSLIQEAYDQCRLYRQYLRTPETGLWQHILWGSHPDPGLWATGNGWAAAGMMRVIATIRNSDYASDFESQTSDLSAWTQEIVSSSFNSSLTRDNLMHNYLNETDTFGDATSTALLTSVAYRLAQFDVTNEFLDQANVLRNKIYNSISTQTGILSPVVDPLNFGQRLSSGGISPEGQAFVLLMESAYRDWSRMSDQAGEPGVAPASDGQTSSTVRKVVERRGTLVVLLACLMVTLA
ncbi:hypothetical protein ACM66B_002397 [Microbotryomycetes sp. NB124-2]